MPETAADAFQRRTDLHAYGDNGLLLFTLETALGLEDIHTVAANALTDGPDDKKCDLLYVDRDAGRVVMAQGYVAADTKRRAAPANKASDLNTALAWLLGGKTAGLPPGLKAAGEELHSALEDGVISTIDIWYSHNLPESTNVKRELARVQKTADSLLRRHYSQAGVEAVIATEVGCNTLEEWHRARSMPILINERLEVRVAETLEASGQHWKAVAASIPLEWLASLYEKHGRKLFSANIRDYLGSRKSDRNINNSIKETAKSAPSRFWAYNNGITALVNDYEVLSDSGGRRLQLMGIAIVNGAQTTGAVGSLGRGNLGKAEVLARFVKTDDKDVVEDIIRYNNTQNKIDAADFRSNDPIQERLRAEFAGLRGCKYLGFRRGSDEDRIRRPQNVIGSHTAAQALVAVHQDPNLAYNEKSRIWESDAVYGKYYSDQLSARHLLFCFSLLRAVEEEKRAIATTKEDQRTASLRDQAQFFGQRGATFLLCAAIAACLETYLGRPVPSSFALSFHDKKSADEAVRAWGPLIKTALPFVGHLMPAAQAGVKSPETIRKSIATFRSLVEATQSANGSVFEAFRKQVDPPKPGLKPRPHRAGRRN